MIFRWRGNGAGTKSAWNDGRNWVNELGTAYAQAVFPGVNNDAVDDVYFDAALGSGAASLAGGNYSSYAIRGLYVTDDYTGGIGASATYAQVQAEDVRLDAKNAQALYIQGSAAIDSVLILAGEVYLKGAFNRVVVLKGVIRIGSGASVTDELSVGWLSSVEDDAVVTIDASAALPEIVTASGGTVSCAAAIETLQITGGAWTQTGDIVSLRLNDGTYCWNDGDIGTAEVVGGRLDVSQTTSLRRVNTIDLYPNGELNLNDGADNVLVTDYIRRFGGAISLAPGYKLAPYPHASFTGANSSTLGIPPTALNNDSVMSAATHVGPQERLYAYCLTGAMTAGANLVIKAQEAATAGGTYTDIAGKSITLTGDDDDKAHLLTVGGWELSAGKPWVRITAAESGSQSAMIAVAVIKTTY